MYIFGLASQEAFGVAFGLGVLVWSFWLLYKWAIKPERDSRQQQAWYANEQMHRKHWEQYRAQGIARRIERSRESMKSGGHKTIRK